jgi:hypothetical protein
LEKRERDKKGFYLQARLRDFPFVFIDLYEIIFFANKDGFFRAFSL